MKKILALALLLITVNLIYIDICVYRIIYSIKSSKMTTQENKTLKTEELANNGDTKSMERLMLDYLNKNDEKARYWARRASEEGSILGSNNLAAMYYYGIGGEVSIEKSIDLYLGTAKKGSIIGIRNLGFIYTRDDSKDKNKGIEFLKLGCSLKDKESCVFLKEAELLTTE